MRKAALGRATSFSRTMRMKAAELISWFSAFKVDVNAYLRMTCRDHSTVWKACNFIAALVWSMNLLFS